MMSVYTCYFSINCKISVYIIFFKIDFHLKGGVFVYVSASENKLQCNFADQLVLVNLVACPC